jgi:hypothetical protein
MIMQKEIDFEHLNFVRDHSDSIRKVLNYLDSNKWMDQISIDEVIKITYGNREVNEKERQENVEIIKTLDSVGCGTYYRGRRTLPTRLELSQAMKDYLRKGQGKTSSDEIMQSKEKIKTKRHTFWLRDDFCVEVELPQDMNHDEASRLAKFVETVPFPLAAKNL